jgi:hypothetical protein
MTLPLSGGRINRLFTLRGFGEGQAVCLCLGFGKARSQMDFLA